MSIVNTINIIEFKNEVVYVKDLKYDSVYKFIVSLGALLASLIFITIGVLINYCNNVIISNNDLSELTENSKNIILKEQKFIGFILDNYCFLIVLFIVGVIMIVFGCIIWYKKIEKPFNRSMELDNKIKEQQITAASQNDKDMKAKNSIIIKEKVNDNSKKKAAGKRTASNMSSINATTSEYYIANELINKALLEFGKGYTIYNGVKIGNLIYDFVIQKESIDIILEIKVTKGEFQFPETRIIRNLKKMEKNYKNELHREVNAIELVFVDKAKISYEEIVDFNSKHNNIILLKNNSIKEVIKKII